MSFSSLSGTSFQSVFKTEIVLDAGVKWGEMLRSRLSGNRVKGPHEWQVCVCVWGGSITQRALKRARNQIFSNSLKNQVSVSGEHVQRAGDGI